MRAFQVAVAQFRAWAEGVAAERQCGEWECDYEHWPALYTAWRELVAGGPVAAWAPDVVALALYAIARDNECQRLARDVPTDALAWLTERALDAGEPDAKWQLGVELGVRGEGAVPLLLALADDPDEYVRRRAIQSLARRSAPEAVALALREWERCPPGEPWARMNALWVLRRMQAPELEAYLLRGEADDDELLQGYSAKLRRGELDA